MYILKQNGVRVFNFKAKVFCKIGKNILKVKYMI